MPDPLALEFEDGALLRLTHKLGGVVELHARGALNPTATAIDISPAQVAEIRVWLNKQDAAKRAELAKEAVAPKAGPIRETQVAGTPRPRKG